MTTFIHASDIHLDSPLHGLERYEDAPVDEIRSASRRAFVNLIDTALERDVDFVIISGDLYDGEWKDYHTGLFFIAQVGRLSNAGIRVFVVSGNHDAASRITRYMPLPDKVLLFDTKKPQSVTLDDLRICIHGQGYGQQVVRENLAAEFPRAVAGYFNIGILHTSLTGRPDHEPYAPCSLDDLVSRGYDYWALGHVHEREIVSTDPYIVFPGNIQGRNIREAGAKGITLVTLDEGGVIDLEQIMTDVLQWLRCSIDISECQIYEQIHATVREEIFRHLSQSGIQTLAMRLELTGTSPYHREMTAYPERIREELRAIVAAMEGVWLEKIVISTREPEVAEPTTETDEILSGLDEVIEELDLQQQNLLDLLPELSGLKSKIPPELIDENSVLEVSGDSLNRIVQEARQLLQSRMRLRRTQG